MYVFGSIVTFPALMAHFWYTAEKMGLSLRQPFKFQRQSAVYRVDANNQTSAEIFHSTQPVRNEIT